ncbi:MAG: hypothetical protein AAGK22_16365 [Acidobacteriota bacterium]
MEFEDLRAILAFIIVYKMVTSPRLRGRQTEEVETIETLTVEPPDKVAPMHMPIQIPSAGLSRFDNEPEKLRIDGPIPGNPRRP